MSKSRDIGDSAATINFIDNLTSDAQTQLNTLTTNVATNATAISNINVTSGSQTKTYGAGETSTITLSGNVLSPIVGVTKEVAQTGTTNNAWDVNSSSENYTRYNSATATTLTFAGLFDLSSASFVDSFDVSSQDTSPHGVAFNNDGTKMFIAGLQGLDINEYTLSSAFDVSTASFVDSFSVSSQDSAIRDVEFNADGTKMYVVGDTNNSIYEYHLSTAFDVSTASYDSTFSVAAQETNPSGMAFNTDGTKMFVLGRSGDDVGEYALSTGFDISTASFTDSFSVASQETGPEGIAFNTDGTKMFIVGEAGDDVNVYTLSTGFDVSTASYTSNFSISSQEADPTGIAFSASGDKMFIVGLAGDDVNEYQMPVTLALGSGSFASADVGKTIEANSGKFLLTSTAGAFTTTTTPANYNQVASGSWQMYGVVFNTTDGDLELSSIGDAFDIANASYVTNSTISGQGTAPEDIAFNSDGSKMFIVDSQQDRINEYALSTAYGIGTESFTRSFSVSSQGNLPTGVCFSNDGTTMLVCDYTEQDVNQYTLSTGFDLSTASYTRTLYVGGQQARPRAVQLVNSGTRIFTIGDTNDEINQWNLSTANDISTASHIGNFSVASQASAPQGLFFSNDGKKVFVLNETATNNIFQYNLSTAFLITSASYSNVSFNTASIDSNPTGIAFSADGTKMFFTGNQNDKVYSYTSGSVTIVSGYHAAHTTTSTDSQYWTDINSMTADEAAGNGAIYYCVSTDDRTTWKVAKGTDGERSIVRNNSGTWQYNSNATYGSTTWTNATVNAELYAIQEAMGTAANQMNKTQLDAIPDANHFTLADDLDLAIIFNLSSGSTAPSSDGVAINYDANVLNQGAILGTDYTYDAPAQNKVRITSTNAANLKIRIV